LVDLDGDGRTDVLSGSWPGEIYFFRRLPDGAFAAGVELKDKAGKVINTGAASTPFAVDWDENGTLDLIVGSVGGDIFFIPNEGKGRELAFGAASKLTLEHDPKHKRERGLVDAAPAVADWDGDGRLDLLVNSVNVNWLRNVRTDDEGFTWFHDEGPLDDRVLAGHDTSPTVVDWDRNGIPDLLVGAEDGHLYYKRNPRAGEKP
jgi:hypothetical protein